MAIKKGLLFAALALAACSSDPLAETDAPVSGSVPAPAAMKIVNTSANAVPGSLLIYFDDRAVGQVEQAAAAAAATRSAATRAGIVDVDEVLGALSVRGLRRVFPCNPKSEERTRAAGLHKWYLVEFDEEADLDLAASRLASVAEVEHVQFNTQLCRMDDYRAVPLGASAAAPAAAAVFNDPYLSKQWHYINTGNRAIAQTARVGADIDVEEAWKLTGGDRRIVVAVVDEGVKYTHPDLAANMWSNADEANDGRDTDGNGYADDLYGYNFVDRGPVTWDKPEDSGHGTHVAGTVAAVNNNGTGVCGVAGGTGSNDGVRIMSCQIFSNDGGGSVAQTAEAIRYAADNGASIIQCSFGYQTTDGSNPIPSDTYYKKNYGIEIQAIEYFVSKKNCEALDGGLAIFAAGNEADGRSSYPGGYVDNISVTAFSTDYLPAYYTNYGPGCNIAAPGGDYKIAADGKSSMVLSTLPSEINEGDDYGYMQGTSMACPHVSGVAALGLSYALKLGKTFSVDEFKAMLLTSVNNIDTYLDGTKGGIDLAQYYKNMGTGAVDAYQLLMQVEGTPCLRAKVGTKQLLPLTEYFGGAASNLTYVGVTMTPEAMTKLGIAEAPTIAYGKLQIKCTKPGVARIKVTAIAGGDTLGGEVEGGQAVTREFAIIARATKNANGGWL